ncbi:MAG TPA: PqqD family protein [Actinomycetota bacterium]|nr:PqqD family protein [Actinomycetota bacterium]
MLKLRDEDLEFREIEGEVVALDVRTSRYIGINRTGASLWELLRSGTDEDAMVARLVDAFGASEEDARRDVTAFVAGLEERGLLQRTE